MFRSHWPINGSSGFLPFTLQFCCKPLGILQKVTKSQKIHISSHDVLKKSHTYEEGGAHLRISFWHLLMNFEKLAGDIIILQMCAKNHIKYSSWDMERDNFFLSIWAIFWLLLPTPSKVLDANKPKFWKNDKSIWRCHHQMMYAYSDMECYRNIFVSLGQFFLLPHYWPGKLKFGKNVKNSWRYYPFTYVHHTSRSYDVCFLINKV